MKIIRCYYFVAALLVVSSSLIGVCHAGISHVGREHNSREVDTERFEVAVTKIPFGVKLEKAIRILEEGLVVGEKAKLEGVDSSIDPRYVTAYYKIKGVHPRFRIVMVMSKVAAAANKDAGWEVHTIQLTERLEIDPKKNPAGLRWKIIGKGWYSGQVK